MKKLAEQIAKGIMNLVDLIDQNFKSVNSKIEDLHAIQDELKDTQDLILIQQNEMLQDIAELKALHNEEPPVDECVSNYGRAGDTGLKTWCWNDTSINGNTEFADNTLKCDIECDKEGAITNDGNRVKFSLNPRTPQANCAGTSFNRRCEISTRPWNVRHPKGTEEWIGFDYKFEDDYVIDTAHPFGMFQVHNGIVGDNPQLILHVGDGNAYGASAGEIVVINGTYFPNQWNDFEATGITPQAGETIKVVAHVIWGDESNGLLQIWINGQSVYDKQVRTVYSDSEWGGNAKFGIYKWRWNSLSNVQASEAQGITSLDTSMGSLKIITRNPSDADYLNNEYETVAPK